MHDITYNIAGLSFKYSCVQFLLTSSIWLLLCTFCIYKYAQNTCAVWALRHGAACRAVTSEAQLGGYGSSL